jgi:hypothetical protein
MITGAEMGLAAPLTGNRASNGVRASEPSARLSKASCNGGLASANRASGS